MSNKAKAINTLFKAKRISFDGVRKDVEEKIITSEEFTIITGELYY